MCSAELHAFVQGTTSRGVICEAATFLLMSLSCGVCMKWHKRHRPRLIHYREQRRHIKLFHIKLFPVGPVTGPPGRGSGQKDLCSLGSEDST